MKKKMDVMCCYGMLTVGALTMFANVQAAEQPSGEAKAIASQTITLDGPDWRIASRAINQWIAWQFNRPEQGDGCVQAFRRQDCADAAQIFRLRGLDPAVTYEVVNFDIAGATRVSGKDLMEKGLTIEIKDKPGAAVVAYQKVK